MILRALLYFKKQMSLAAEELAYKWNLGLLKKLTINSVSNPVNVLLLREVIRERLQEEHDPSYPRPLSRKVL